MANHRSIRDEQKLLLMPAYDKVRQVVPVAAVFGANASGKSNLLDALRWAQQSVRESFRVWEPGSGIPRRRCRFIDESVPSSFVVDLIIDGVQYLYGMTLNSEAVEEEWLNAYPHGRERVIFNRQGLTVELGSTVRERRSRTEQLTNLLRDNALLLSVAAQAGQPEVVPVYEWFRDRLTFAERSTADLARRFHSAAVQFPSFVDLFMTADLGITGVLVEKTPRPLSQSVYDMEISFRHGVEGVMLGPEDQSDGTLNWADLLISALWALHGGSALIIDEVDASLHPRLTARLIELFRSSQTNDKGAQLIFTTHDATLLGTSLGDEVLRRDEIWFVEKEEGASRIYPLSDFHPRKGENHERRYLAGSYGAVPVIFGDSLVRSMLAGRTDPDDAGA